MKKVHLTHEQMQTAEEVATVVRHRYETEVESRFVPDGQKAKKVPALRSFANAYCAEMAVAQALGLRWNRGDDMENVRRRRADVGEDHEVRWTGAREPELRLYDPDDPTSQDRGHLDRKFWLVTGFPPQMTIHGFMVGHAIVREGTKKRNPEGKWSYYVPAFQIPRWPSEAPLGTPLGPPRPCPSCKSLHPAGTTCADGWSPWKGEA